MKILVFGANGQVGNELNSALSRWLNWGADGYEVIYSSRNEIDLAETSQISAYLSSIAPKIIVNTSAYTDVDKAESQPDLAFLINEAAVREMAIYCARNHGILIHISTDYVFGGNSFKPYLESDPAAPTSVYGSSKFAGEESVREVLDQHIILRTSWVFGLYGANFVKTMLRLAETKSELDVVADQVGAPTSARVIASVIVQIISTLRSPMNREKYWGTYHFCGVPFVSWAEFANEIFAQALDLELIDDVPRVNPILTSEYPTPAARPANSRLDCYKFQSAFGINPDDWKSSLGSMLEELKVGMLN